MAASRFLEPDRWIAEAEAAGYKPNTRLNNALKARQAAIDALTPLVEAKEKLTKKIRALETEYKNVSTTRDREMELEAELSGRYGLYAKRWALRETIREAEKHLADVERRVASAKKELDDVEQSYIRARTVGEEEASAYEANCENRIEKAKQVASARSADFLSESKRLLKERTDNFEAKISDSMVVARSDALKREAKKVLEEAEAAIWEIEEDATRHQRDYEKKLDDTHKTLLRVGGSVKEADKSVLAYHQDGTKKAE
jgi:hypothetical protein